MQTMSQTTSIATKTTKTTNYGWDTNNSFRIIRGEVKENVGNILEIEQSGGDGRTTDPTLGDEVNS